MPSSADTLTFQSGTDWQVSDSQGAVLGQAQNVCVNANNPATCPTGATVYGFAGSAWTANLSSIAGSTWIWAPGVMGSTSSADLQQYDFSQSIQVAAVPIGGTISIAADDFAQVFVNGISVGSTGSVTDFGVAVAAQQNLTTFDISAELTRGRNTITVLAENGPASFAGCNGSCTYAQNPAGVVFGGEIDTAPVPEPSSFWLCVPLSLLCCMRLGVSATQR
jgi:hypothetical protein